MWCLNSSIGLDPTQSGIWTTAYQIIQSTMNQVLSMPGDHYRSWKLLPPCKHFILLACQEGDLSAIPFKHISSLGGFFRKKIKSYTYESKWKSKKQALLFLNDDRKMRQEGREQIRQSNTSWNAGKEQETVWVSQTFPKAKCVHPSICTAHKMSWATAILQETGGGKMVLALCSQAKAAVRCKSKLIADFLMRREKSFRFPISHIVI